MDARLSHRFAVLVVVAAVAAAGCGRDPVVLADTYGDCVLQHVESGMDSGVVAVVRNACRSKFPIETEEPTDAMVAALDEDALARLDFRRAGGNNSILVGVLYNGNPNVTLTEVDISLATVVDGEEQSRVYRTRQMVQPYGTANVQLTILPADRGAPERASVTGAKGRAAQ
jgi:hypothetical protein